MAEFCGGGRVRGGISSGQGNFRLVIDPEVDKNFAEDPQVRSLVGKMAEGMAELARDNIVSDGLIDTGDMLASVTSHIRTIANKISAVATVGTDHWQYVEYGTGQRGESSLQPLKLAQGYRHGSAAGIRAYAFMRRAFLETKAAFERGDYAP